MSESGGGFGRGGRAFARKRRLVLKGFKGATALRTKKSWILHFGRNRRSIIVPSWVVEVPMESAGRPGSELGKLAVVARDWTPVILSARAAAAGSGV